MAISSAASLSLPLITNPLSPPSSLSSSNSVFFNNGGRTDFLVKKNACVVLSRSRAQRGLECNCIFGLGVPELAVIAGVAVLVFGPKKLPEIGRSIGKTVKSFQQAAKEFETELKKEPEEVTDSPLVKPVSRSDDEKEVTGARESS